MTQASFPEFLDVFNAAQGRATPPLHHRIAAWLDARNAAGEAQLCLLAFRNAGKSSLVGLYCAWLLARRPGLRILVVAAEHGLATAMVAHVREILQQHPLAAHLAPDGAWARDRFTVARSGTWREPSMLAKGLTANLTGSRADVVICDDVEVPNTADTLSKCAELRRKLAELAYVLVPGGTQLVVGTPHTRYSIYQDSPVAELGEERPFLDGFATLRVPLLDAAGACAWPERFPPEAVAALKRRTGPAKFASQMQLQPVAIRPGQFDPQRLGRYHAEPGYGEVQGRAYLRLGERRLVSASCAWDPAYGGGGRDRSVLALVYVDSGGSYYLHRCLYLDAPAAAGDAADGTATGGASPPEAVRQCREVAAAAAQFLVPAIRLESNGLGGFLPDLLRRELAAAGVACAVIAEASRRPKAERIREGLDAPLAAGALHAHDSVFATPLVRELAEWRDDAPAGELADDGLDAVSACLLGEPVRLARPRAPAPPRRDWRPGAAPATARTTFRP